MPPPCGGTQGADRNLNSVWPGEEHFLGIDAGKHAEKVWLLLMHQPNFSGEN